MDYDENTFDKEPKTSLQIKYDYIDHFIAQRTTNYAPKCCIQGSRVQNLLAPVELNK